MRVALTGGATGIGAEVAAKLMVGGHDVTAFDIRKPAVPVTRWIETDLSDPASIATAVAAAAAHGPFDALVNNAGLPPRDGLEEVILRVNFLGLRAFLAGMLDRLSDGAAIVNTASRAGAAWRTPRSRSKASIKRSASGCSWTRNPASPSRARSTSAKVPLAG